MIRFVLAFILVLGFACCCQAEFYRYVDENGNVIFTDDLTKVPPAQRPTVKKYKTMDDNPPAPAEVGRDSDTETPKTEPAANKVDEAEQIKMERQKLVEREQRLKAQFAALEAERKQLMEQRKQAETDEQVSQLNAGIDAYNAKIKKYEAEQKSFDRDVKAFNAKLKALVEAQAAKVRKAQP